MAGVRSILIWGALAGVAGLPVFVAAQSEYLQYRNAIYVVAGFAGIIALALLLVQPLLAAGLLPGLATPAARRAHRWIGGALVLAVALHVAGLWITSPPDMIDALTFTAPTAFSAFGVVAMWALIAAALLALFRRTLRLRPRVWLLAHTAAVVVAAGGSVAHAVMVEGTMGAGSKALICVALIAALALALRRLRPWAGVSTLRKTGAQDRTSPRDQR